MKLILDVGCGGRPHGNVNLDIGVGESKHHNYDYNVRNHPNFSKGSVLMLPYRDNQFDAVICSHTPEHIPNPIEALSEIHRVTKNLAVLRVPNIRVLQEPMLTHLYSWSVDSFRNFCKTRFQDVQTYADCRSVLIYEFRIIKRLLRFKIIRRPLERILSRILGLKVVAYCWKKKPMISSQ